MYTKDLTSEELQDAKDLTESDMRIATQDLRDIEEEEASRELQKTLDYMKANK